MHFDGSLNKIEFEKTVFGFLRRKRQGKPHISPEVNEFERLRSLPPPATSPVPICWNTPVKVKDYYLSKSTAQLLPPPLPVKIMAKIRARTPDLTINTDTANNTRAPFKQDSKFVLPKALNSSPSSFENQRAVAPQRGASLHKSRSMGVMRDKAHPFELSPPRKELVKSEHSLVEAAKSADSSSDSSSDEGLDKEELLQAEYNKLFQIGRERGYDDDEVRQWVDYVLEHGLPEPKTGSEADFEAMETEVDCDNARIPEFTQTDPAVKEIERHYLQDVFGKDTISTRQLLVDNEYTPDKLAAPSASRSIYLHGNSDIASHTTLKAYSPDDTSSFSSSAASHSINLPAPKIEQSRVADSGGSGHISTTPNADLIWFRADMDASQIRDSPNIRFKAMDSAAQEQELKVVGTSAVVNPQHKATFTPSKMTQYNLYPSTHHTPNGLIPLLLPLRYTKEKRHDSGHSSATGRLAPLNRKWKEQHSEAAATLPNLADRPTSTDSYEDQSYDSLTDSLEDKQSEAADLSGVASEVSTSYSDSPTLGYAHLSTPTTTVQDIYGPTSSRSHPRSSPSFSPFANNKKKMPPKKGPGKFKASSGDVSLLSPSGTFSESSFNSYRRASTVVTKWDEEMRYANEKLQALRCETSTEIIWRNDTDPALKWRNHPNHNREWESANLRCTTCLGFCRVCRAPCCVYSEVMHSMRDLNNLPEEKRETAKLLKKIDQWCPQGIDIPTSLQCTECYRMVCTNCCGICPIFPCHDLICKECKTNPWAPCDGVHEEQTRNYLQALRARDRVQYFQH